MAEKTIEQVAEDINGAVAGVKTELNDSIEKKADKETVETLTAEVEKVATLEQKQAEVDALVKTLQTEITAIREQSQQSEQKKKGELVLYLDQKDRKENVAKPFGQKERVENTLMIKMTTADVLPVAGGLFNQLFGNFIDTSLYEDPKRDPFMLELVSVTSQPGTESIWYAERVNEVGNAQFIAEGTPKPDISAQWQQRQAPIREVAESWVMTERLMNHAPSVVSNFREHADDLIELRIDAGLFDGTGVAPDIDGITTLASPFVVPPQLALFYTFANIFDVINAVATSIKLADYKGPMTVVLNPVWEAVMLGIKEATTGTYIVPPFVTTNGDTFVVNGMPVVFNTYVGDDEILLGILPNFKVVFAENIAFAEGFINDDFTRNQVRFRLAAWLGTYLPESQRGSIVFDNISTILTAISAP
jgi:HK97 family phage major capsid protein